jgi:adenylate kinase family enzyme
MRIVVVQLGDVHIKDEGNPVLGRGNAIAAAIRPNLLGSDGVLLLNTGDVAYSGLAGQYTLAETLFNDLCAALKAEDSNMNIFSAGVPGNHDCDLLSASDVRDIPALFPRVAALQLTGETVRHCLAVQTEFFKFLNSIGASGSPPQPAFFWEIALSVNGEALVLRCYNTAWLTQNPERPGQLYFPLNAAPISTDNGVAISLFHHPYNWLAPDNARAFRTHIESSSDVVLTGHEHVSDTYSKSHPALSAVTFVEGAALFESSTGDSGFNIISIDTGTEKYSVTEYSWRDNLYRPKTTVSFDFVRRPKTSNSLEITDQFATYLDDLGTGFTHPRKDHLRLSDVFVYPDLRKAPLQQKMEGTTATGTRIASKDCPTSLMEAKLAIIIGAPKAGKTTLAKTLVRYINSTNEIAPLLLTGNDIASPDTSTIRQAVDLAVERQYGKQNIETFRQLPRERIAIILDDFDRAKLTRKGQARLLALAEQLAATIILTVADTFPVDELTTKGTDHPFYAYEQFELQPLGRVLRGDIIEKWVRLGQEYVGSEVDISHEIDSREKTIQALLSKQLVPSYPVIVLGILQACEASKASIDRSSGSYGELFESLITERVRRVSTKATEIGKTYTIVARIAFFMYQANRKKVTFQELQAVLRAYFDQYRVSVDHMDLIGRLTNADILSESAGMFEFRYPYYYHYFVARYIHENMSDPTEQAKLSADVKKMADRVYRDDYVDILVFYLYLSRDQDIIEQVCRNAERVYEEYQLCDLEEDVGFINQLYIKKPEPIAIPDSDIEENRRRLRSEVDEQEELLRPTRTDEDIEYERGLDELIKLNIAFKTIYVLGQVLRSFPGVLKHDVKVRVVRECYRLGLRIMSVVLRVASENLEEFRKYFAQVVKETQHIESRRDLAVDADELMIWLTGACTFGIVKRISLTIGHEDLGETYKEILSSARGDLAIEVLDLAIKLDHFKTAPDEEVKHLSEYTDRSRNYFVYTLVRDLVRQYLSLFRIDSGPRERMMKHLKIEKKGPLMLEKSLVK